MAEVTDLPSSVVDTPSPRPNPDSITTTCPKKGKITNLSPIQQGHKSAADHPSDKAHSLDITTKVRRKSLPKLEPPTPHKDKPISDIFQGHNELNHSSPHKNHKLKPDQQHPLAPLDMHTPTKETLLPHRHLPSKTSPQHPYHAKVPPLDQMSAAMLSNNRSPEKSDQDNIISILSTDGAASKSSKKKNMGPTLEPLQTQPVISYRPEDNNGSVTLLYEMYHEKFDIKLGSITEVDINNVYGLCDVMPNCRLKLSTMTPTEVREATVKESGVGDQASTPSVKYMPEHPKGTFSNLENNQSYYVYVRQDSAELRKEQVERDKFNMKNIMDREKKDKIERDDGRGLDGCTCIYGTPCVVRLSVHLEYFDLLL